jgi:hypothetical protein
MNSRTEPWYIHAALYVVIAVLVYILIQVAIIQPNKTVAAENYFRQESRLRMDNIKEAQILYFQKNNRFTPHLDSLVYFLKNDRLVDSVRNAYDSLSRRPADPFKKLTTGEFTPDSLLRTPKTYSTYIVTVDTSTSIDTIMNRQGKMLRVDTNTVIGSRYYIEDPDGYGSIGSVENDALRNTASWE